MLLGIALKYGIPKVLLRSNATAKLTKLFTDNLANERNSTIKNSQAGQAGAVPPPDTAPWVGGPHQADYDNPIEVILEHVNDWDAPLFNQHASGTIADLVNDRMSEAFSTNGTSYNNRKR